jgi:ATPase family associated with various cellular activities (AAA)
MLHPPDGPPARAQLPALPLTVRTLSNEKLRWLRTQYPDLPTNPSQCVTCSGRRTFRWWDATRTEVVEYDCPCDDQWILHLVLLHAGVGINYQRLGWNDFFDLRDEHAEVATDYLNNAPAYVSAGIGLLLHGRKGDGKTMFGSLIVKELVCRHRVDAMVITFAAMLEMFSAGWKDAGLRDHFAVRVRNAGVLFMDDVGREYQSERSISKSTVEDVLRHRAQHGRPTIISTNPTPDDLKVAYGPNVASVLSESMIEVPFEGVDRRPQVRARTISEIKAGLSRPLVIS